jgi:hypothetical protein
MRDGLLRLVAERARANNVGQLMAPEALNQRSSKANQKNLLHGVCHTSQERKRDKLSQPNTVGWQSISTGTCPQRRLKPNTLQTLPETKRTAPGLAPFMASLSILLLGVQWTAHITRGRRRTRQQS